MGLIPPIDESDPTSLARSPYEIDIIRFVTLFALSPVRVTILKGFLTFRHELYSVGILDGFQWIDGSFTENIELIERRSPNDVDVVTFFNYLNNDSDEAIVGRNPIVFDHDHVKKTYLVDSFFQPLQVPGGQLVDMTGYWYSMWSHKRDSSWKGFLKIPLSPQQDQVAMTILNNATAGGGEQ